MLQITWEWLGQDPALDIANTVAIVDADEHDMVADVAEYERWAAAEASALGLNREEEGALLGARARVLGLRKAVRAIIAATAEGRPLPRTAAAELNRASRAAPVAGARPSIGSPPPRQPRSRRRHPHRDLRAGGDGAGGSGRVRRSPPLPGALMRDVLSPEPKRPALVLTAMRLSCTRGPALPRA